MPEKKARSVRLSHGPASAAASAIRCCSVHLVGARARVRARARARARAGARLVLELGLGDRASAREG